MSLNFQSFENENNGKDEYEGQVEKDEDITNLNYIVASMELKGIRKILLLRSCFRIINQSSELIKIKFDLKEEEKVAQDEWKNESEFFVAFGDFAPIPIYLLNSLFSFRTGNKQSDLFLLENLIHELNRTQYVNIKLKIDLFDIERN